jgi:hypothetical protein
MRNVHIIPTDKPSRLWINNLLQGKLELSKEVLIGSNTAQHIYITSDEEIKGGDYVTNGKYIGQAINEWWTKFYIGNPKLNYWKIILTTDPDLIKDGVQAIDDDFLEWFVKNPSCEEIELKKGFADGTAWGYNFLDYKIIIPQEEPKQIKCYCGHTITCDCEPLQETLEEPTEEAKQRAENYMSLKGALESKQTVVDFIISQLKEHITQSAHNELGTTIRTGDYRIGLTKAIHFCEQAKEMEKDKMENLWHAAIFHGGCKCYDEIMTFEQYYNETFNIKKP